MRHLSDATLARLWTQGLEGGTAVHPHLDACAVCRARLDGFGRWLGEIGDVIRDDADEALSAERLAAQQAQIARRLEALDRPARVLAFPKAAHAVINGHSNVRRWVTVAAAACLIAGFGLGQVFPLRQAIYKQQAVAPVTLTQQKTQELVQEIAPESKTPNDEDLLSDSFTKSHVLSLTGLDDMTPHARDIVLNKRNKQYK